MKVAGGTAAIVDSVAILLAAIAVKSFLFSILQKRLSFFHAAGLMLAGNLLTTVIGILAAAMIGSGSILVVGFFVVWALCVIPSRRLLGGVNRPWLKKFTAAGLAGFLALALVISCILFSVSTIFIDSNQLVIYWIFKLAAVYLALIVKIGRAHV